MMPPIRTSAMTITRQQINERLLALQNALPAASLSSLQDSPTLPLLVSACSTTDNNATTMAVCACISIYIDRLKRHTQFGMSPKWPDLRRHLHYSYAALDLRRHRLPDTT
ncbi:hypothetical protein LguiB_020935 [Lonicera macranthoides]